MTLRPLAPGWAAIWMAVAALLVGIIAGISTRSMTPVWAGFLVALVLAVGVGSVGVLSGVRPPKASLVGIVAWIVVVGGFVLLAYSLREWGSP